MAGGGNKFIKSVVWSPDGNCLLSSTEDSGMLVHQLDGALLDECRYYSAGRTIQTDGESSNVASSSNGMHLRLSLNGGSPVYACQWYPCMNSQNPETCCFISTCKDRPVQLWSALAGQVRCSYVARNHMDELETSTIVGFNLQGNRIYAGSKSAIRVFDVDTPGSSCSERRHKGMVSALAFNPDYSGAYAAGTYAKSITIYVEDVELPALELSALDFDVTCLKWSSDGVNLWAGGRNHDDIVCWDLRHTRAEVGRIKRKLSSSQKMAFDLDPWSSHVVTGSQDGKILFYDATTFALAASHSPAATDCTNGVSMHPFASLLAVSSGQRHFALHDVDDDDNLEGVMAAAAESITSDSKLSLWTMPYTQREGVQNDNN